MRCKQAGKGNWKSRFLEAWATRGRRSAIWYRRSAVLPRQTISGEEGATNKHWRSHDMIGKVIINLILDGFRKIAYQCTGIF
jgi:hypothetical protein